MLHLPSLRTKSAVRAAGALLSAGLVLAACNGAGNVAPPGNTPPPQPATSTPEPELQTLDEEAATELYVSWRETVYALRPTEPEEVDIDAAGEGVVVPGSEAADWIRQELDLARERGVLVRGDIHAEPGSPVQVAGEEATVTMCSSADVRPTDVATGEPVGDEAVDASYTRFDVDFRRIDDDWLVERAEPNDDRDCVPPSIEEAVEARWELFTEAWYERDRQGGGEELGPLTEVVTDEFADILRGLPPRDPVPNPAPFTDFELIAATRTSATGQACRSGGMEAVEWVLVDGQWRVDFAGQAGQEATPCP